MRFLYSWRFTNWLMAKPWRWHYRRIWDDFGEYPTPRAHPFLRLWYTLTFPHVHAPEEACRWRKDKLSQRASRRRRGF